MLIIQLLSCEKLGIYPLEMTSNFFISKRTGKNFLVEMLIIFDHTKATATFVLNIEPISVRKNIT